MGEHKLSLEGGYWSKMQSLLFASMFLYLGLGGGILAGSPIKRCLWPSKMNEFVDAVKIHLVSIMVCDGVFRSSRRSLASGVVPV
jgi:hypothetical protein